MIISPVFKDWMLACDGSPTASRDFEEALEGMRNTAGGFSDWRNIFYRVPHGGAIERLALSQMAMFAQTFGNWVNVCQEARGIDEAIRKVALQKLASLADSPTDATWTKNRDALRIPRWEKVFQLSDSKSDLETRALERIVELTREEKEAENNGRQNLPSPKL